MNLLGRGIEWNVKLDPSKLCVWEVISTCFMTYYKHNIDNEPYRFEMMFVFKEPSKSFKACAKKWRNLAPQVHPYVEVPEMVNLFL